MGRYVGMGEDGGGSLKTPATSGTIGGGWT